ncbi:uncharacterized protein LOC132717599 [Ruditapes philippinarum]|uniref:uncharacterized protein LOC132717599 n=1 Tax=Ruditapes philippinarum TaxID=129788 RepID=UPI00295ACF8B|nr:uncharacterized protein LOC132717599 [Ruditapes philippinarum]
MAESTTVCETESKGSEDVFEMYCEACHREGQHEIACAFCSACVTYFCTTCLKYHGKFYPVHKPLEGENMPQDICMETCKTHTKEILKYFCTTCNKFVCCICKPELHKETCNMKYLPDYVTNTKVAEELKGCKTFNDDIAKRFSDFKRKKDIKYESLSAFATEAKSSIQSANELTFAQFNEEITKVDDKILSAKTKDMLSLDKAKEKIQLLQRETDRLSEKIEAIKQLPKGCRYTIFLEMKRLGEDLTKMNEILRDLTKELSKLDNDFECEVKKKSNDLSKRVKEFGRCIATAKKHFGKEREKTACFIEDINVKDSFDQRDYFISHLCVLSEQYLVMSDHNNCCLKLVNLKSKMLFDRLSLKSSPDAVTKILDSEIAIVRSYENDENRSIIQFLKLTNAKQLVFKKRYILTGMRCSDIACIGEEKLLIAMTANYHGKLQIRNLTEQGIQTIDKDDNGKYLCNCPCHLHVDKTEKSFYVTDWLRDKFYKVDIDTLDI